MAFVMAFSTFLLVVCAFASVKAACISGVVTIATIESGGASSEIQRAVQLAISNLNGNGTFGGQVNLTTIAPIDPIITNAASAISKAVANRVRTSMNFFRP